MLAISTLRNFFMSQYHRRARRFPQPRGLQSLLLEIDDLGGDKDQQLILIIIALLSFKEPAQTRHLSQSGNAIFGPVLGRFQDTTDIDRFPVIHLDFS